MLEMETGVHKVVRRSGEVCPFDATKISSAITRAGEASGEFGPATAQALTIRVLSVLEQVYAEGAIPNVEEIQDIVEEVLLASSYRKTAKAYIIYREQHARMREMLAQNKVDLVDAYLTREDWQVNENSNMSFSLQGLNNYISSEISKNYWLHSIYPETIRHAPQ